MTAEQTDTATPKQKTNDDYDSPWKAALDGYLKDFLVFYFPDLYASIDWTKDYESLDNEFQSIAQDADVGKHRADKLFKVNTLDGRSKFLYVHVEIQSQKDSDFEERMFTYNYRIFDKYKQLPVSLAVLADTNKRWKPNQFKLSEHGCQIQFTFPTVKLIDLEIDLDTLTANDNPFAILTAAHFLTKRTAKTPKDRYDLKFKVIRMLYERNWEKEEMIKFLSVIDVLMKLPESFAVKLRERVHILEEETRMRYLTSFEQLAMAEGMQQGMQQGMQAGIQQGKFSGMIDAIREMFTLRFPQVDMSAYADKFRSIAETKIAEYGLRIATAKTPEEVFADDIDEKNEKK
jgi:hypothetical protein